MCFKMNWISHFYCIFVVRCTNRKVLSLYCSHMLNSYVRKCKAKKWCKGNFGKCRGNRPVRDKLSSNLPRVHFLIAILLCKQWLVHFMNGRPREEPQRKISKVWSLWPIHPFDYEQKRRNKIYKTSAQKILPSIHIHQSAGRDKIDRGNYVPKSTD